MDKSRWNHDSLNLGDHSTSDVIICLRTKEDRQKLFLHVHSFVLREKSKFFANKISQPDFYSQIEIHCSELDFNHHVELVKRLYCPRDLLLDSWGSVQSAIGGLQVAAVLGCEEIIESCIQYLEAVPWEDKEEEEIIKLAKKLGPVAMPILARIKPVDLVATKNVFISAIRFATSIGDPCPPFGDELKTSAQEQIDYMLGDDEDVPLITADDDVKLEARSGLSNLCSCFGNKLSMLLLLDSEKVDPCDYSSAEDTALRILSDLEWMCNILPKMDLMKDFVASWVEMSNKILVIISDQKLEAVFWGMKVKLIELTAKVLEAVGYGNVILPAECRVHLLKMWLPYIRKMKPLLDSMGQKETKFPHKMDEELCQNIEGAIVSLILALPSNDQADILADWMVINNSAEQVTYPDLSEAFEVWCYRTKSAKRRLVEGGSLDQVGNNNTVSL
ncbi:OLC1v1028873C4 [Oldenlandia corymbosa var. corymbosa]|uniref:OLC1v1028873C4 n=1 Tax=Oldenlandia corymbosa var. corymbosa TaxID=529605 RepID=A0AAV1CDZ3_OLDCO|nr:OLC1v1028873C4 [Oldenlandia corymbosa var. corymbosa]